MLSGLDTYRPGVAVARFPPALESWAQPRLLGACPAGHAPVERLPRLRPRAEEVRANESEIDTMLILQV
jgi:hypothetical protein